MTVRSGAAPARPHALTLYPTLKRLDDPAGQFFAVAVGLDLSNRTDVVIRSLAESDFFSLMAVCVSVTLDRVMIAPHFP
ncbi:hypothetical protein AOG23_33935 [Rhizobium acidisoli]|nr:hypothetical protein AOG23_33935 [Rhizobium acidisoli]